MEEKYRGEGEWKITKVAAFKYFERYSSLDFIRGLSRSTVDEDS